ncbi:hypothetical protein [Henriciella sp.]|uniref:hypothetical protein n=1 Tax=Henriciella sp. TaxID=1968823 RepID=UPI0017C8C789|nr:hypothetical protein [Henriciella sp.]HIG21065.1 hypothetical protein [Henriciella sp.]
MKTLELYEFVNETDLSLDDGVEQRKRIAILGLVSEIGSILAALKKDLLVANNKENTREQSLVRGELIEEIGDTIWYAVMLAQCILEDEQADAARDIFKSGISRLKQHLTGKSRNNRRTQAQLEPEKISAFVKEADIFLESENASIDEFQILAYKTRRTDDRQLKDICSAVLQQLAAQLSRDLLPDSELILNHEVRPKDSVKALGEMIWHLAALASLFKFKLSDSIAAVKEKSEFRNPSGRPGPDHSTKGDAEEQFPKKFQVHFVSLNDKTADMYWVEHDRCIKKLGDPLTDNNYADDGYRFHDVMHIAFAAYLGWSPNLRSFMGLKRKSVAEIDNVEDGGRAKILEEAIILEIHETAKAKRKHLQFAGCADTVSPFGYDNALNFGFLRRLRAMTFGHEVYENPKQDWEAAIKNGYQCYEQLREHMGGIISVDTDEKSISFTALDETNRIDYSTPSIPPKRRLCEVCRTAL